jgi:lysophospholipase L1-like esterase
MRSKKLIVFGDSVTAGTSAKLDVFHECFKYKTTYVNFVRESQTWHSILGRILADWAADDVEVVNAGMAGDTSKKALVRLKKSVLAPSPDYVLLMFGLEDVLQGIKPDEFRKNLETIICEITAQNARPVLMTPTPISERMTAAGCTFEELRRRQERLSDLAQAVRSIAEEKSLDLIDLHRYFLDTRLAYDHIYEGCLPDGVAQSGMASFIAGELLPMLGVSDFPGLNLCDYRKVYSDAGNYLTMHNGFTDLTYFEGEFYVAFRTGAIHGLRGLLGGKTLVLRSADGIVWLKDAELKVEGFVDTRDPKFLHVGDRLMVYPICHNLPSTGHEAQTYGFELIGKEKWSAPFECAPCVLWRPKKWRDQFVAAGCSWRWVGGKKDYMVSHYQSPDGHNWEKASVILGYGTGGNETQLFVENDTLMAFSRNESSSHEMYISTYIPSENRWETVSSGRLIHAPCVFKAGERTIIIGRYCSQSDERFRELRADWQKFSSYVQQPDEEGYKTVAEAAGVDPARIEEYHHGLRTGVFVMDGTRPRLVMELLSAGDSSYVGVVPYGDEFVISDYSMHEYYPEIKSPGDWQTPCDIYLSRIRFGG